MSNLARALYVGVTDKLERRVSQHKTKALPGFTSRYSLTRLVYCESTNDVSAAIAREKQVKGWLRSKKSALIELMNPGWDDLAQSWELVETGTGPSLRSG